MKNKFITYEEISLKKDILRRELKKFMDNLKKEDIELFSDEAYNVGFITVVISSGEIKNPINFYDNADINRPLYEYLEQLERK